jgi:hypothetical protein
MSFTKKIFFLLTLPVSFAITDHLSSTYNNVKWILLLSNEYQNFMVQPQYQLNQNLIKYHKKHKIKILTI